MTLLDQANTLAQSGQPASAVVLYEQYLEQQPIDYAAWNNRGNSLDDLGRREEAIASFDHALAIHPNYPQALCNKGVVLINLRHYPEALLCIDRCLELEPRFVMAHTNRGNALRALGRFEEAIASHDKAIAIDPEFANAHWNQSLCRLLMGDYTKGWPQYEWRWKAPGPVGQLRATPIPTWLGKVSIDRKRIMLWPEGGDGDVFQFVRFARELQALGATVMLPTRASMFALFESSFPDIELLPMLDSPQLPEFDYQSSLMSMPLALGIDHESRVPALLTYLKPEASHVIAWAKKLGTQNATKRRIGLCWAGNPMTEEDNLRSLHLTQLNELLQQAPSLNVQLVSLQKGYATDQLEAWNAANPNALVLDFANDTANWADTAALIANLDLVITTCTSIAHLAGAMGKPTWVLVGRSAYWVWSSGRSDNVWYPTARLFRQPAFGDWGTVIIDVISALDECKKSENL
jgi:TPR repeat/Tetratricopeptide repeat